MSNYSIEERGDAPVIYKGSKNFWKTRSNLEIIIAEHRIASIFIFEVICHDSNTDIDERLYIDCTRLRKNISPVLIESAMTAKIEQYNRAKKAFAKPILEQKVIQDLMINYVVARTFMESSGGDHGKAEVGLPDELAFSVVFRQPDGNELDCVDPLCEKPSTLIPLRIVFPKKCT
jgi:hypothetical protein